MSDSPVKEFTFSKRILKAGMSFAFGFFNSLRSREIFPAQKSLTLNFLNIKL